MSQEIENIKYCPGHSYSDKRQRGRCASCNKDHFIQEFKTWSSGNTDIDKIIQESQINNFHKLQWIPYDNFQNIEHIADGSQGSVYSTKLEKGIKWNWNFIKRNWEYNLIGYKVAFKEINSRYDIAELLKVLKTVDGYFFAKYYGISKNPSTQNYIIVMDLFDDNLHDLLTKTFWELRWQSKLDILSSIVDGLGILHEKNFVHCDLHSRNILNKNIYSTVLDLGLCKLENDIILNSNTKNNKIYGLIPYIPPEVLRGNEFTKKGDIYSFGGIMYEIVTAQRPFVDQAHDTYLMIDICNGVRPKIPDFMLNWIPEWYLDLMYRCWNDDPSERPTADELFNLFYVISGKLSDDIVDDDVMQQLQIADENQQNTSKSQNKELFDLFSHSSKIHPQSCYIGRHIHTLHGLRDLLEEIKSGKSSDPNLLIKSNESRSILAINRNSKQVEK
ncbi:hypothetical protein Glove_527g8 [Diversispora epigaea]|uniref:Protein kinase domain-containing protein n=1 Tax=Diversispora epigaea TaxID=1348612 RepID=A0A397GFJ5_9GLOM|nr:hypothetical protein Glove_527g8 [Diversispora epigaea]